MWFQKISTSTSTFNLVGKYLQISHQPLKTKMNVKNVKNIHTPPTEGIGNSGEEGGLKDPTILSNI